MKLDDKSRIPLYYQLEQLIRRKIKEGEYPIDEKIPSERVLSEQLNLSRMTITKAVNALVEEGVLYRKRGQGTFVAKEKVGFFPGLLGFTEMIESKGMIPSSKVLTQCITTVDDTIMEQLQLSRDEKVLYTERIRLADQQIINLEKSYVPHRLCPELLDADLSLESIYKLLEQSGYKPSSGNQEIQAILASSELSRLLQIAEHDAILLRKRVTYSGDIPIQYSVNYYRGDAYTLIMTINN